MDYTLYQALLQLCVDVYHNKSYKHSKILDHYSNFSGLDITLFSYKSNVIFTVKGTELPKINDLIADGVMTRGHVPNQAYKAQQYYENIKNKYKNIIFTGHSLGGSICQYLGQNYKLPTVTFSSYGLPIKRNVNYDNIINFGCESDALFTCNLDCQLGRVYIIPDPSWKYSFIKHGKIDNRLFANRTKSTNLKMHSPENWPSLTTAIRYK